LIKKSSEITKKVHPAITWIIPARIARQQHGERTGEQTEKKKQRPNGLCFFNEQV
jgi:hypothetical protein